jgi:hypothetical protein
LEQKVAEELRTEGAQGCATLLAATYITPFNIRGNMENSRSYFLVDTFLIFDDQPALKPLHEKFLAPFQLDCNFGKRSAHLPSTAQSMPDK